MSCLLATHHTHAMVMLVTAFYSNANSNDTPSEHTTMREHQPGKHAYHGFFTHCQVLSERVVFTHIRVKLGAYHDHQGHFVGSTSDLLAASSVFFTALHTACTSPCCICLPWLSWRHSAHWRTPPMHAHVVSTCYSPHTCYGHACHHFLLECELK